MVRTAPRDAPKAAEPGTVEALQEVMGSLGIPPLPTYTIDGVEVDFSEATRRGVPWNTQQLAWTSAELAVLQSSQEARWQQQDREDAALMSSPQARPRLNDFSPFPNPYWDEVRQIPGDPVSMRFPVFDEGWSPATYNRRALGGDAGFPTFPDRMNLVRRYSWAITAPESVAFVAAWAGKHGLVEIGAGTGYWAACLAHCGVDTVAYDHLPPDREENFYHRQTKTVGDIRTGMTDVWGGHVPTWHPVRKGRPWHASRHPHRTLFLCWPPFSRVCYSSTDRTSPNNADNLSYAALRHYRGNRVIFIGEGDGGCTGTEDFFHLLDTEWHEVDSHRPVQWNGIRDWITVYERGPEEP
jgi:hypothetical protein